MLKIGANTSSIKPDEFSFREQFSSDNQAPSTSQDNSLVNDNCGKKAFKAPSGGEQGTRSPSSRKWHLTSDSDEFKFNLKCLQKSPGEGPRPALDPAADRRSRECDPIGKSLDGQRVTPDTSTGACETRESIGAEATTKRNELSVRGLRMQKRRNVPDRPRNATWGMTGADSDDCKSEGSPPDRAERKLPNAEKGQNADVSKAEEGLYGQISQIISSGPKSESAKIWAIIRNVRAFLRTEKVIVKEVRQGGAESGEERAKQETIQRDMEQMKKQLGLLQDQYTRIDQQNAKMDQVIAEMLKTKEHGPNEGQIDQKKGKKDKKKKPLKQKQLRICENLSAQKRALQQKILSIVNRSDTPESGVAGLEHREQRIHSLLESIYETRRHVDEALGVCISRCKKRLKKVHVHMNRADPVELSPERGPMEEDSLSQFKDKVADFAELYVSHVQEQCAGGDCRQGPASPGQLDPIREETACQSETLAGPGKGSQGKLEDKNGAGAEEARATRKGKVRANAQEESKKVKSRTRKSKISKNSKNVKKKPKEKKERKAARKGGRPRKASRTAQASRAKISQKDLYINSELCTRRSVYSRINKLREFTRFMSSERASKARSKLQAKATEKTAKAKTPKKELKYFDQDSLISLAPDEVDSYFSSQREEASGKRGSLDLEQNRYLTESAGKTGGSGGEAPGEAGEGLGKKKQNLGKRMVKKKRGLATKSRTAAKEAEPKKTRRGRRKAKIKKKRKAN